MATYQIYRLEDQGEECWRWQLKDGDTVIAESEESFLKGSIAPSIKRIRQEVPNAPIWEDESRADQDRGYRFEYSKNRERNQCDWRLRAGNHETMAIGQAPSKDIERSLKKVKSVMAEATIEWKNPTDDPAYQAKHDDRTETKGIAGS